MCMISRWIFDCCDREYWTWKPRSCDIPGQRCNRADWWYISQTIKKVNIGPCWKCEDARAHQQPSNDQRDNKRKLDGDEEDDDKRAEQNSKRRMRKGDGSPSNWTGIKVIEIKDTSVCAANHASRFVHQHAEDEAQRKPQCGGQYGLGLRSHGLGSVSKIEIRRDSVYESADESPKASSSVSRARARASNHQNQSSNGLSPVSTYVESVARPSQRQVPAAFHVDRDSWDEVSESFRAAKATSSAYAMASYKMTYSYGPNHRQDDVSHGGGWFQEAELDEHEQQNNDWGVRQEPASSPHTHASRADLDIYEQQDCHRSFTQEAVSSSYGHHEHDCQIFEQQHHDFALEWKYIGDPARSPGSYLDSVLGTPSALPLPPNSSEDEESFASAPVSDQDTFFAAG